MPFPNHFREKLDKHVQWNAVIDKFFEDLESEIKCSFCDSSNVQVLWSVFNAEPRTASLDIACAGCGEKMHAAVLLPNNVPDVFQKLQ